MGRVKIPGALERAPRVAKVFILPTITITKGSFQRGKDISTPTKGEVPNFKTKESSSQEIHLLTTENSK